MPTTTHTPERWEWEEPVPLTGITPTIREPRPEAQVLSSNGRPILRHRAPWKVNPHDAEHLVRCVNTYPALLGALQEIARVGEDSVLGEMARAAIATTRES